MFFEVKEKKANEANPQKRNYAMQQNDNYENEGKWNGRRNFGTTTRRVLLPEVPEINPIIDLEYVPHSKIFPWIQELQKVWRDFRVSGQQTKQELRGRKAVMDTNLQLNRDRGKELVNAFRSELGTAMKKNQFTWAENIHAAELETEERLAAAKIASIKHFITACYIEMSTLDDDLPEEYKNVIVEHVMLILKDALKKIRETDSDFDEFMKKSFATKRSSWVASLF